MRFVPVKTAEQQAGLMLVGVRDRLIRNRTQLSNAIRGYAGEFGLAAVALARKTARIGWTLMVTGENYAAKAAPAALAAAA
jgi:transposase